MGIELYYMAELGHMTIYAAARTAAAAEKLVYQWAEEHGFNHDVEAGSIFMEKIESNEYYRHFHYPKNNTVVLRDMP